MPRKSGTSGSEGGRRKRTHTTGTSPATYPTARPVREGVAGSGPFLPRLAAYLVVWGDYQGTLADASS